MKRIVLASSLALGLTASAAAQSAQEREALETYCMSDIERLCPNMPIGHDNLKNCLRTNQKEMSVGCAEALKKLRDG